MSEPSNDFDSLQSTSASREESSSPSEEVPRFGLIDIVEAFTAMRHEWRGQTKESRALAESLQVAVASIEAMKEDLSARIVPLSDGEARQHAETLTLLDHQLTRAIAAIRQTEVRRKRQELFSAEAIEQYYRVMNPAARWFARGLFRFVMQQHDSRQEQDSDEAPAIEGLKLILARLHHAMKEQQIERIETMGQPFDPKTMNAIEGVESQEFPPGHVTEVVFPGYRWRGQILRFADVRVATQPRATMA